jgi:hypothetical protein
MAKRLAEINCNREIHNNSSDLIGGPEHKWYSWSKNLPLEVGGFSKDWE